ncbi:DUF1997 domain-containing protein [Moorena sp. SIO4G3]|uniref:DUF1997 domain-containing protein n=1 Tax=Moorena sp. SIO4G3 TaxID=2607821 RepID=UPI001428FC56|nr:DUF1997 domain-containing protein [Moorena sp. SIO4G3]NEO81858.1 DUF1997 domain-containing protein [Moorena sp. SIO4G3]
MRSHFINHQSIEEKQVDLNTPAIKADTDPIVPSASYSGSEPTRFHCHFQDCMEMYASAEQVSAYLNTHQDWFCRCAHPMKVKLLTDNGYILTIGSFGAFGYRVEPKIGLELLPLEENSYQIRTIPIPNYVSPGYDLDFQASQTLVEVPAREYFQEHQLESESIPSAITRVEWHLDLSVEMWFPKAILKLPQSLIQRTGNGILQQVVRQVSRRLTHKVQEDFHSSNGLPIPKQSRQH